ncbi:unnamed protein product [Effrenium voratum]|nr:unnamed protein product [Effrenium voratum]
MAAPEWPPAGTAELAGRQTHTGSNALATLGRRSYVSMRGLDARDENLARQRTEFGELIQDIEIPAGREIIKVPVIRPAAMLAAATHHCEGWRAFFIERLQACPSTYEQPWRLAFYADEVSPGNQLKHSNERKVQVIYWSLQELGPHALGTEACWFPLVACRSTTVLKAGGMSVFWRRCMELFFEEPSDFRLGLFMHTRPPCALFATLGVLVADEAAIKQALENKGASGTILCCHCSNVVDFKSQLDKCDRSSHLVNSLSTDASTWRLHTHNSIQRTVEHLEEQRAVLNQGQFARLEQSLGFNYRPAGLLAHPAWGAQFLEKTMFDWMHVYVVSGIANVQTGLMVGDLTRHGTTLRHLQDFVCSFQWPARLRGAAPRSALEKRGSAYEAIKCSASELLNLLVLLRAFLLLFVCPTAEGRVQEVVQCFLKLCEILDTLIALPKRTPNHDQLQQLVASHLEDFKRVHGAEHWTTKFHLSLHLPLLLKRHRCLISCFVHERKHKCVKRVANNVLDTSKSFEKAIMSDVLYHQLDSMKPASEMPGSAVSLVNAKTAPAHLASRVLRALDFAAADTQVETAVEAVHSGGYTVAKGDVACLHLGGSAAPGMLRVGRVQFHASASGACWTCLHMWEHVHGFMYKAREDPVMVPTAWLWDTCPWSQRGDAAIVLLPAV